MKVIVTRPRAQARPLVAAARGARRRGRRVPADRDRAHLRRAGRRRGLRLARSSRARTAPTRSRGAARNLPPIAAVGPGTAEALREHGIEPAFVAVASRRRTGCCASSRGRRAACSSPPPRARAAGRSTRSAPTSSRSTARGCSTPEPPDGDVVVLASGSAARAYAGVGGGAPAVSDRAGDLARRRARSGSTSSAEAPTHDLDGLVARGRAI